MLLLDVQEHEVRLNGSSKSHCPTGEGAFEMEFREELLLERNQLQVVPY